ncbi:hypothetical protein Tco_1051432 [Tanacetum coccineum]
MGNENHIRTLGDYSKPSHEGYRNTIELPVGNNVVPLRSDTIRLVQNGCSFHGLRSEDSNHHLKDFLKLVDSLDLDGKLVIYSFLNVNPATRRTIDQSAGGKLRDRNAKESWALLEDLALYDNESWNDPRDFPKPVKEISLPQDVPSTSDRHLIELENQVQCLVEAHLAPKQHVQVNKISSSCKICNGPHDTQYCMKNPEQAFVEYASSRTEEVGGFVSNFMASQDVRLSKFEADFKQQQSEMTNKIDTVLKAITDRIMRTLPSDTVKNLKLNINVTSLVLSTRSYPTGDPNAHLIPLIRSMPLPESEVVKMDDPNITMEEYIRLEEEKARRHGKVYNWETATYAIVFNDALTSEVTLSCEPTVSPLNDNKIDFRISFDESDDEDYTFDDLDFFKDFENEFPAIVYNDALTSKSDSSTKPIKIPHHIDEFDLKTKTSLSECYEEEQNVVYFNDLFHFNIIYSDDSKSDKDNDDHEIDIKQSSRGNVINIDDGAYAHGSNKFLETSHDKSNKFFKAKTFIKELNVNIMTWNHLNKGMSFIFLIKNLYVPFGIPFDPKLFYKDGIKLGQV